MNVKFPWSERDPKTNAYRPIEAKGEVVQWIVVPDQQTAYGDPSVTVYNPSAIVLTEFGAFVVVRVEQLQYAP